MQAAESLLTYPSSRYLRTSHMHQPYKFFLRNEKNDSRVGMWNNKKIVMILYVAPQLNGWMVIKMQPIIVIKVAVDSK